MAMSKVLIFKTMYLVFLSSLFLNWLKSLLKEVQVWPHIGRLRSLRLLSPVNRSWDYWSNYKLHHLIFIFAYVAFLPWPYHLPEMPYKEIHTI
jgi:hypothetical protein